MTVQDLSRRVGKIYRSEHDLGAVLGLIAQGLPFVQVTERKARRSGPDPSLDPMGRRMDVQNKVHCKQTNEMQIRSKLGSATVSYQEV